MKHFNFHFKRRKNNFIYMFFIFAFLGYSFFFSSSLWFPESKITKLFTPFDTTETLDNHDFTLKNWVWSPSQSMMEIEIDVNNKNFDNQNSYLFSCRDKSYHAIPYEPIITTKDLLVLHIKEVPEDFKELSFRLKLESSDSSTAMVKFYTNRNQIPQVDQITTKTENGYYMARLERNIENYQKEKTELNNQISELQGKILSAETDIQNLKEKSNYDSATEAKKTAKNIEEMQSTISSFEVSIANLQDSILIIDNEIKEAEAKLSAEKGSD